MSQKAIFPKYRIMHDGGGYRPYYIERRYYPFFWVWYFHLGYFKSVTEAVDVLNAGKGEAKPDRFIRYV